MKKITYLFAIAVLCTSQVACAATTHSAQGVKNIAKASGNMSRATGHSLAGVAKVGTAVVSIPLVAVGGVGKAVGEIGNDMWTSSTKPLEISDDVVVAGPPPSVE